MNASDIADSETVTTVVLTFSNGWKPGVVRVVEASSTIAAVDKLAGGRWCWIPDESSDLAVVADRDILVDQLDCGSPAWLIEPASGEMVHMQLQSISH